MVRSGTTGRPKGVVSTHGGCMSHFNMEMFASVLALIGKGPTLYDEARALFESRLSGGGGPKPPVGLFDVSCLL